MRHLSTSIVLLVFIGLTSFSFGQTRPCPPHCVTEENVLQSDCSYCVIPESFCPNDDPANALTISISDEVRNFTLSVYSRWGNEVYRSENKDFRWNGTDFNTGNMLPIGTYFYVCGYECGGEDHTLSGNLSLTH